MPQPSFQQVSYPGFGQQNPQAFAYQNNPYLGYQQQIPYAGAQRPVAQTIPLQGKDPLAEVIKEVFRVIKLAKIVKKKKIYNICLWL